MRGKRQFPTLTMQWVWASGGGDDSAGQRSHDDFAWGRIAPLRHVHLFHKYVLLYNGKIALMVLPALPGHRIQTRGAYPDTEEGKPPETSPWNFRDLDES